MERKGIRTITRIYLLQQSLFATGNPAPTWIEADRRLLELSVAPSRSPNEATPCHHHYYNHQKCRIIFCAATLSEINGTATDYVLWPSPQQLWLEKSRNLHSKLEVHRAQFHLFFPLFSVMSHRARGYGRFFRVILWSISLAASKSEPIISQGEEPSIVILLSGMNNPWCYEKWPLEMI